jgi:prepilin signal peptidase PulO-like enzyme (type II secretory pathway)
MYIIELFLGMAALCAAYLSWQDWRHESVPIWALGLWGLICIIYAYTIHFHKDTFIALASVSALLYLYQWVRKKELIGFADIVIITSLCVGISLDMAPLFLILAGLLGSATAYFTSSKHFPFLPSIFVAAAITITLQSFNRIFS